jgi:hypothetical protein
LNNDDDDVLFHSEVPQNLFENKTTNFFDDDTSLRVNVT